MTPRGEIFLKNFGNFGNLHFCTFWPVRGRWPACLRSHSAPNRVSCPYLWECMSSIFFFSSSRTYRVGLNVFFDCAMQVLQACIFSILWATGGQETCLRSHSAPNRVSCPYLWECMSSIFFFSSSRTYRVGLNVFFDCAMQVLQACIFSILWSTGGQETCFQSISASNRVSCAYMWESVSRIFFFSSIRTCRVG